MISASFHALMGAPKVANGHMEADGAVVPGLFVYFTAESDLCEVALSCRDGTGLSMSIEADDFARFCRAYLAAYGGDA